MTERQVRITLRDKQTTGGSIPGTALLGEPFINLYDGVLKFSGVTGGGFETSNQTDVFEVGSALYNQKITNRLSVNGNFVVSGDTGLISTYDSTSGSGLIGKFLSGTTSGFVLGDITDIQGVTTEVQPGVNITTGGTALNPIVNLVDSPSVNNINYSGTSIGGSSIANSVSATTSIYSAGTSLETIIYNIATSTENITSVQPGVNILTGGTPSSPIINLVDSPSVNNLSFSGTVIGSDLYASNISGGTLYSGSTNIYDIFVDSVNSGSNTTIGGSASNPVVNVVASPSFNNVNYSGTSIGGSSIANSVSATTSIYSAGTSLETIIYNIAASTENITSVQPGTNITTGGTASSPIINVVPSPSFAGLVSATGFTDSSLTSTRVVYVGASGRLVDKNGFSYDQTTDTLNTLHATLGIPNQTGTTLTIHGDVVVFGEAISGFTSQLYIEDNFIELNYNPTASTESTSLGAGWSIQDGSGVAGTDVFLDIRGTGTTVSNRGFATNLNDIYIRESGTVSAPNGVRVLAEFDVLDGGNF